jgi:hypothetical protein
VAFRVPAVRVAVEVRQVAQASLLMFPGAVGAVRDTMLLATHSLHTRQQAQDKAQ